MAEILIADDERVIRDGMKALFVGEGFSVRVARDGEEALQRFREQRPDLVLLDVMMPKLNGFRVCEEIRRADRLVPILFLTAKAGDVDQLRGLGLGADDYLSKTTDDAVLLARVRRALERVDGLVPPSARRTLTLGRVTIDLDRSLVLSDDGGEVSLTRSEADILKLLADADGTLLSGDQIVTALRGQGFACEDGMVYSHVSNLRRKLGPAGELLVCNRGAGYRLVR